VHVEDEAVRHRLVQPLRHGVSHDDARSLEADDHRPTAGSQRGATRFGDWPAALTAAMAASRRISAPERASQARCGRRSKSVISEPAKCSPRCTNAATVPGARVLPPPMYAIFTAPMAGR
jgi:hypothetical protein